MKKKGAHLSVATILFVLHGLSSEPVDGAGDELGLEDLTELKVQVDLVSE